MSQPPLTIHTSLPENGKLVVTFNQTLTTDPLGVTRYADDDHDINPEHGSELLKILMARLLTKHSGVEYIDVHERTLAIKYDPNVLVTRLTAVLFSACNAITDTVTVVNREGRPIERAGETPFAYGAFE